MLPKSVKKLQVTYWSRKQSKLLRSHDPNLYTTAAGTSRGNPAQLLADNTAAESLEVRVSMGARESIKRFIHREKAKAFPKSSTGLPDLVMPDEWPQIGRMIICI